MLALLYMLPNHLTFMYAENPSSQDTVPLVANENLDEMEMLIRDTRYHNEAIHNVMSCPQWSRF